MKNQHGFIPKRYMQPDYYRLIFNGWCAVYIHPQTRTAYHLQLKPKPWARSDTPVSEIEVLRQDKDCRRPVSRTLTTIKAAVEVIDRLFSPKE